MKLQNKLLLLTALAFTFVGSAFAASDVEKTSYWYAEASPTYMLGFREGIIYTAPVDYDYKVERKFVGTFLSFGYQFNKWHQVQVDVGYLQSKEMEITEDLIWHSTKKVTHGSYTSNEKYTMIPALAAYSICIPVWKSFSIKVGPSIGCVYGKSHYLKIAESRTDSSFVYGANAAFRWDISGSIYTQIGIKFLNMTATDSHDEKMDTYSGFATFGWKF